VPTDRITVGAGAADVARIVEDCRV